MDEVAICETDGEPNCGVVDEPEPIVYGSTSSTTSCTINLSDEFSPDDMMNDGFGWDLWDGSDEEDLSTFELDPVLPYSGDASMRIDITEGHDVAEFHHRFGNDLLLEDGMDYTVTLWMRTNVPEGDTMRAFTRAVRDTDWTSQFAVDFISTQNEWLNYSFSFTADGTWDNAFIEMKLYRVTGFTGAYSVWLDDVQICAAADAVVGLDKLEDKGVSFRLAPNPVIEGGEARILIHSEELLDNASIRLVDLFGRILWTNSTDITPGQQHLRIPTQGLPAGMYLINIEHQGFQNTLKLQVLGRS